MIHKPTFSAETELEKGLDSLARYKGMVRKNNFEICQSL